MHKHSLHYLLASFSALCALSMTSIAFAGSQEIASNPAFANAQQQINSANAAAKTQFEQTFPHPTAPTIPTNPAASTPQTASSSNGTSQTQQNPATPPSSLSPDNTPQNSNAYQNSNDNNTINNQAQVQNQNNQVAPAQPGNIYLPPSGSTQNAQGNAPVNIYH